MTGLLTREPAPISAVIEVISPPGVGTISLPARVAKEDSSIHLRKVLHVPDLASTGCSLISHTGTLLMQGYRKDDLYHLRKTSNCPRGEKALVARAPPAVPIDIAHRRLGHLNAQAIKLLAKGDIARDFAIKEGQPSNCTPCAIALALVHADLVGPITPQTSGGGQYSLEFCDDFSRWQWHFILKEKSSETPN